MASQWPKFPTAKSSLIIDIVSETGLLSNDKLKNTIDCHYFSNNIQIISSNQEVIPIIERLLISDKDLSYYLIKNLPIRLLINKILINGFIKKGKLFGLSVNREIDIDDCLALLPNGVIVLSLKESTYHRLGIVGKKSILFGKKSLVNKYVVEIDMNKDYFTPGTKHYDRTYECLQRSQLCFDFLIKWKVDEQLETQNISSFSIKNFFDYIKTHSIDDDLSLMEIIHCMPSLRKFTNNYVPIPRLSDGFLLEDIKDLIEWLGSQICQIDCNQTQDMDVSTFGVSDPQLIHHISCIELSGFFTRFDVTNLIESVDHVFKNGVNSIIVNGFEDTPIAWKGSRNEHNKRVSGENLYGLAVIDSTHKQFIWRVADEFDFGIETL